MTPTPTPTLESTIESLRLIRVIYGSEQGLVSLTIGKLLAHVPERTLHTTDGILTVTVRDHQMERMFGEAHTWNDLIGWLRKTFHWESKTIIDPKATRCANCKFFGDVTALNGTILLGNVCTAPTELRDPDAAQGIWVTQTNPNSECELFTPRPWEK